MKVIQVYAPHNERADELQEQFYEMLQQAVDQCNRQDIVIMMGDLKAKFVRITTDMKGQWALKVVRGYVKVLYLGHQSAERC